MKNQLFDVIQNDVAEAGKGPAVGGGSIKQLGGRHEGRRTGGEELEGGGSVRWDEEEQVRVGYLSEPGVAHHHNAVGHALRANLPAGKKRWSTGMKRTEAPPGGLPSV